MYKPRKCIFILFSLLLIFFSDNHADAAFKAVGVEGFPWKALLRPGIMGATNNNEVNFTTDLFLPFLGDKTTIFYINPHIRFDDNDTSEINIGIGWRSMFFNDTGILGLNLYYDSMKSSNSNKYNQLGIGIEALSRWMDFRFNYYNPSGSNTERVYDLDTYKFTSKSLIQYMGYEEVMEGVDVEIGTMIPFISDYIETRVYIGGYYYDSDIISNFEGIKGRLSIKPCPFINIEIEVREDNERGHDTFIGGYLDIPFTFDKKKFMRNIKNSLKLGQSPRSLKQRMTEKVVRDRYIVINEELSKTPDKIKDIIFVDNNKLEPGKGTYENPYNDFTDAQADPLFKPDTWIFVFSSPQPYTLNNFTLLDNMVIWGQQYRHPLYQLGGDGSRPVLQDDDGMDNVITLNNNNELWGVEITSGSYGIWGDGITGLSMKSVNVHGNTTGIYLKNSGFSITNSSFNNNTTNGMELISDTGNVLSGFIKDCTFNNNGGHGLLADASLSSSLFLSIKGSNFDSNFSDGLHAVADNSFTSIDIANTSYNDNSNGGGIYVEGRNNSDFTLLTSGAALQNNNLHGMTAIADNNSTFDLKLVGTTMHQNTEDGLNILADNNSTLNCLLNVSNLSLNDGNGIFAESKLSSTLNLRILGDMFLWNVIQENGGNGVDILVNNSTLDLEVLGTYFVNNTKNGINIDAQDANDPEEVKIKITSSGFSNNKSNGLNININNSECSLSIKESIFNNSDPGLTNENGVNIVANDSTIAVIARGSQFSNNSGNGFNMEIKNGDSFFAFIDSFFNDNTGNGLNIDIINDLFLGLTILNSEFNNNDNGLSFTADSLPQQLDGEGNPIPHPVQISNSFFNNNTENGIFINANSDTNLANTTELFVGINSSEINYNNIGLYAGSQDGAELRCEIQGDADNLNSFINNSSAGIYLEPVGTTIDIFGYYSEVYNETPPADYYDIDASGTGGTLYYDPETFIFNTNNNVTLDPTL